VRQKGTLLVLQQFTETNQKQLSKISQLKLNIYQTARRHTQVKVILFYVEKITKLYWI